MIDSEYMETFQLSKKQSTTHNAYGLTSECKDPNFMISLKLVDKQKPVADLGVCFGFSTNILIKHGFDVIANDLSKENLEILWKNLSLEERGRLILKPGNAFELDFEKNSLGGVFALRWMHFLSGLEVRSMFKKFYEWLSPGGVLVVSCRTPYSWTFNKTCLEKFVAYKNNKEEWPGEFLTKDIVIDRHLLKVFPEKFNLFTIEILIREALLAGLIIFKASYMDLSPDQQEFIPDGPRKDFCSLIAIKIN